MAAVNGAINRLTIFPFTISAHLGLMVLDGRKAIHQINTISGVKTSLLSAIPAIVPSIIWTKSKPSRSYRGPSAERSENDMPRSVSGPA